MKASTLAELNMAESFMGKEVEDKITGYTGICTGYCRSLYGCIQMSVNPKVKENKLETGNWLDMGRLTIIGKGVTEEDVASPDNKKGCLGERGPGGMI